MFNIFPEWLYNKIVGDYLKDYIYEICVSDDCSPDNSISIVEEYARKHANLVIVRNQYNRKLGGARNAGMEVAQGDYVWFIDSDDFIKTFCIGKF